jgi:hypothetical protein
LAALVICVVIAFFEQAARTMEDTTGILALHIW